MRTVRPWLRFIEGTEGGQAGAPQEENPATPTEATPADQAEETPPTPEVEEGEDPDAAKVAEDDKFDRSYVEKLRRGEAAHRTRSKELEAELAETQERFSMFEREIKKLFGNDEEEQTPEQLIQAANERAEQAAKELRTLKTERAIQDAAKEHGADTKVLLPLLRGLGAFDALDPTADDCTSQVETLVAETVEKFPQVRTTKVPASSGNAPTPTPHESTKYLNEEDLLRMQEAGEYEAINKAFAAGRFKFTKEK